MAPRILIADDDEDLIALHKWILARGGFELSVATNGHEALRLIREMRPNLVLTDYMMPGMNGLEVGCQIRGQLELADVPVVILTASCERTLRQAAQLATLQPIGKSPLARELTGKNPEDTRGQPELSVLSVARLKQGIHLNCLRSLRLTLECDANSDWPENSGSHARSYVT